MGIVITKEIRRARYVTPVNSSYPYDEESRSCYHYGDYESFYRKREDCNFLYGKLIMNDRDNLSLYVRCNFP
ncbi:hypothetical protein OSTOST_06397 [Ostertagia ostertagi]